MFIIGEGLRFVQTLKVTIHIYIGTYIRTVSCNKLLYAPFEQNNMHYSIHFCPYSIYFCPDQTGCKAIQPVPGNNTLAANLMARAWNSSSELQTATTIEAARMIAQKRARNLLL